MTTAMSESCRTASIEHGEPIAGSAVACTAVWIVLEHRGPWGNKAVPESDLPEAVKGRLMQWQKEIAGARVQLVRRSKRTEGSLRLWLAVSDLGGARMFGWTLEDADALTAVDVPAAVEAIRAGASVPGAQESTTPLVLVCTNGRRDVCCAKWGVPVVQALEQEPGLDVWQTTHLGGHRFAATLLQLPQGLCYGRVMPEEASALAAAIRQGQVYRLDRLRGRTALHGVEQAAEVAWRAASGEAHIGALARVEHVEADDAVMVTLHGHDGRSHQVALERRELGPSAPPSCGKPPAPVAGWFQRSA